jgi:hypothetical protein
MWPAARFARVAHMGVAATAQTACCCLLLASTRMGKGCGQVGQVEGSQLSGQMQKQCTSSTGGHPGHCTRKPSCWPRRGARRLSCCQTHVRCPEISPKPQTHTRPIDGCLPPCSSSNTGILRVQTTGQACSRHRVGLPALLTAQSRSVSTCKRDGVLCAWGPACTPYQLKPTTNHDVRELVRAAVCRRQGRMQAQRGSKVQMGLGIALLLAAWAAPALGDVYVMVRALSSPSCTGRKQRAARLTAKRVQHCA